MKNGFFIHVERSFFFVEESVAVEYFFLQREVIILTYFSFFCIRIQAMQLLNFQASRISSLIPPC